MTSPLRDEPQQWVRVPVEPTQQMCEAALTASRATELAQGQPPPLPVAYELWSSEFIYKQMISAAPKDSKHIERAMKLVHEIAAFKWSEGLSDGNFDKSGARNANKEADELMTELRALLEGGDDGNV